MRTTRPPATRSLDLSGVANRGFCAVAGCGQAGGWTGEEGQDLRGLRPGPLPARGLVFTLADAAANGNRSLLALRNDDPAFCAHAVVATDDCLCTWIYLLHASSWVAYGVEIGVLTLVYAEGGQEAFAIRQGSEIGGWWGDDDPDRALRLDLPGAHADPHALVGLFACALRNPQPHRRVSQLDFALSPTLPEGRGLNKGTWLIPAVSLGGGANRLRGPARVAIAACPERAQGVIRRLHGGNIGAPIFHEKLREHANLLLRELDIPLMRLHDCPWDNAGMDLVDIHQVFPLFHADHTDPANYNFGPTDDFIANCLANGSRPFYRLGVSIEHMAHKRFAHPPADMGKWAEICVNIIRHYNHGWANGFHHGLAYWEIWNEPEPGHLSMWSGSWDDYIRLYVTTARRIKEACPEVKVGGPSFGGFNQKTKELAGRLLASCREHGAPLDFFSWHKYGSSVPSLVAQPGQVKAFLTEHGFPQAELHLNEWHYTHGPWLLMGPGAADTIATWNGLDGAAFLCAVLIGWQDTPLDMGAYYTCSNMPWFGLFDAFGQPNACWYGMKCFAEMTRHPQRFAVEAPAGATVWALGGSDGHGRSAILIACLKKSPRSIVLRLAGQALAQGRLAVRILDADHQLEAVQPLAVADGTITVRKAEGSAVILVTF